MDELQNFIKNNCYRKDGRLNSRISSKNWWIKKGFPLMFDQIQNLTSFLPITSPFRQRIWHIINNNLEIIKCSCNGCLNPTSWQKTRQNYSIYCSLRCSKFG